MRYYNTNEKYGEPGPFEAESKEALADEMMDTFKRWSFEKILKDDLPCLVSFEDAEFKYIHEMRTEFIAGLEECER